MKRNRIAVAGVTVIVCFLPLLASAITAEELGAQIQALMAQIGALQQGIPQSSMPNSNSAVMSSACPFLSRTLSMGSRGSDVVELQEFLAETGHFYANATGYFGLMTQTAVQEWQAGHDIVSSGDSSSTGWGVVGVRTRAAIAAQCRNVSAPIPLAPSCPIAPPPLTLCSTKWQANTDANGCTISYKCSVPLSGVAPVIPTPAGQLFSASRTSGAYPLTTTFYTNIQSPTSYADGAYQIDYGDGRVDSIAGCSLASVCALDSGAHMHIYATAGTYVARLIFINRASCTTSSAVCTGGQQTVASVPITVGGTVSSSISAAPVSGTAPLTTTFTTSLIETAGHSLRVDFGDGGSSNSLNVLTCTNSSTCTFQVAHTYSSSGTYAVKLRKISLYSSQCSGIDCDVVGMTTVTVQGTVSAVNLTATPTSGAVPLAVTFSIPSTPGQNKKLYFGDGLSDTTGCQSTAAWTITHTYATSSTYFPYLATPCTTSGATYSLGTATIVVGATSSAPAVTVTTASSSVVKGQTLAITWGSQNAPSGSVVLLRLVHSQTGIGAGIVARSQNTSGNYTWAVPTATSVACPDCGGVQTVPLGSYKISAEIYTPSNAWLGDTYPPANPPLPTYLATASSSAFSITQ